VVLHDGCPDGGSGPARLGGLTIGKRRWRPFEEAREYAHSLSLKNKAGWVAHCKSGQRPDDVPAYPNEVYEGQWASWGDWLGTGDRKGGWRPFEEARELARTLALGGQGGWRRYARSGEKPDDFPSRPDAVYEGKGWVDWADFLGTGSHKGGWRSFEEAREHVRSLGLKTTDEWTAYARSADKPANILAYPREVYKDQWESMGDWLGTGYVATFRRKYRPFEEARAFVRTLGLKDYKEWEEYCRSGKKPDDIPSSPWAVYGNKWKRT
jgi:Phage-integrase repeat unit